MISFVALSRKIELKLSFSKFIVKPIIAVVAMGASAYYSHYLLLGLLNSNAIATLLAIGIAIVVYGIMLLALNIFDKEELARIPVINKFLVK
jgi:hypothetical protein